MCYKPAFPNNLGANGGFPWTGINSIDFITHLSNGLVLSGYFIVREPLYIFSNPNAKAHSYKPPSTKFLAKSKAEDPVAQLLFTL